MSARMDRLEFYRELNFGDLTPGDWRWRYVAANGHILAVSSEGYRRRIDAVKAAARVTGYTFASLGLAVSEAAQNGPQAYESAVRSIRVVVTS